MATDVPGAPFIRRELPYPIALGWQRVVLAGDSSERAQAAVGAVEAALRVVTGLQLASLLDARAPRLPDVLEKFGRPTMGSWELLASALQRACAAHGPFVPELARWPGPHAKLLRAVVSQRNGLVHSDLQHAPARQREARERFIADAARLLETLDWLRRYPLVRFLDHETREDGVFAGRVVHLAGYDALQSPQRAVWRGWTRADALYLWDGGSRLLDVSPFIGWDRLGDAPDAGLLLWSGRGGRGDVRVTDIVHGAWQYVGPLSPEDPAARVSELAFIEHAPRTADALAPLTPPEPPSRPALVGRRPIRRHLLLALAGVVLTGLGVLAVVKLASNPNMSALADGSQAGGELATSSRALTTDCEVRALAGEWSFDTEVRGAKPEFERYIGVRGHYRLTLEPGAGCALHGELWKVGYTQAGAHRMDDATDAVHAQGSATGATAAIRAALRRERSSGAAEIAMRVVARGDRLFGLWRHEGADAVRAGYWGPLIGQRSGAAPSSDLLMTCFARCVVPRHAGADPMTEATEPDLQGCADDAERCARGDAAGER